MPKLSTLSTIPRPKSQCQTRLARTRAVSGFSGATIHSASSRRPLVFAGMTGAAPVLSALTNPRGTFSPGLSGSPRAKSGLSVIVPNAAARPKTWLRMPSRSVPPNPAAVPGAGRSRTPTASAFGCPLVSKELSSASSSPTWLISRSARAPF